MLSGFSTTVDVSTARDRGALLNAGMTVSGSFFLFFFTYSLCYFVFVSLSFDIVSLGIINCIVVIV